MKEKYRLTCMLTDGKDYDCKAGHQLIKGIFLGIIPNIETIRLTRFEGNNNIRDTGETGGSLNADDHRGKRLSSRK